MTLTVAPPLHDLADLPNHMQARIKVDGAGCWLWQTGLDNYGYGRCSLRVPWTTRRRWSAHRLSWLILVGEIGEGLHLDHLCRVRNCVNPAHLEPVTPTENVRRSTAAAYWRNKTHCPRGHEYDEANTGHDTKGHRICRTCARDRMRERRGTQPRNFKVTEAPRPESVAS
jgi:hypothetical protein